MPPTEGAANEHCLRVYHQIQAWFSNKMDPLNYGWQKGDNGLEPITSKDPMIPPEVSESISCKCSTETACGKHCGCRKHGLKCTRMCENCNGESCENCHTAEYELDDAEKECESEMDVLDELLNDSEEIVQPTKKRKINKN